MSQTDLPPWQQALLIIANEKGIEAARHQFTQGLHPLSRQHRQMERIFLRLEQDTDTGQWGFKSE